MARARPIITACVLTMLVVTAAVSCSGDDGDNGDGTGADGEETTTSAPIAGEPVLAARTEPLPVVTPTPRGIRWLGPDVPVPSTVDVIAADGVGESTTAAVRNALEGAGARDVNVTAAAASGA
ncbi:MAG TPA: hypothetical protein VJM75_09325, partial [Acidimicrobiales bacterium]|nr:hypothetical protein [Acidimicrobiales bacterium]